MTASSQTFVRAADQPAVPESDPEMLFDIPYPASLSRWKVLVKWLLVTPHLVLFGLLAPVFLAVVVLAWFSILLTGRFPRPLWNFELQYMRRSTNQTTYAITLQRDEYPPFGEAPYPAVLDIAYPEALARWKVLVKWLFMLPNLLALAVVMAISAIAVFVAFWAILITGRYPRPLFDFVTGAFRWGHRWGAYFYLMTDRYPPFRLT
ncbi:MAG: DUF4389 domain-containing protein [Thermomicrobiales bacterium]|nr:DUF4389 domain-containing protein [Thermomicrobiales bacterium]